MSFHEEEVLGKAYDARLMGRLLTYLRPHKWYVAGALLALVGDAVAQLAPPYLVKVAIDQYIAQGDFAGLNRIAFLYLGVLISAFSLEYAQTFMMQMIGQRIMYDMRMQIYAHLQRLDLSFYDRNPVGRLMTRVTTDVDVINDLFTSGVVAAFGDLFMLAGIMATLLWMDWRLALITFSVLPLILALAQWFRYNVRESYRKVRARIARINAFLNEHINGMATVQLFRREQVNYARFDAINAEHRDANVEQIFFYAVFLPAVEFVAAIATALILWFGGGVVMSGALTLGSLVAFILYAGRFFRPISDMSEKFNTLQAAMASSERIFQLIDTPVSIQGPIQGPKPKAQGPGPVSKGHIVFEDVSFAYNAGKVTGPDQLEYVLRNVSFEVKPGERVGIVGATGAGKSTLISLLLRFYDVTGGRILVDGIDIRDRDLSDLRKLFGLVLQDVHLFSGTIAGNIRLGNESIDDARVRDAARAVHAHRFIEALPGGYDAKVAERGATLSVGQKQLLSFARALAFDPAVLILDEATSSVDTETELLIRDALHVLMSGRTTLAIAHRLSTIQDMDTILVFHKGKLRESGSHQRLLAMRGIYYKLFQLQYKGREDRPSPTTAAPLPDPGGAPAPEELPGVSQT
ncbi:MAG TPA: ABC transporter ATP-binding protein [Vicinamibacterales bacterium]|nr:ABC transporter ATP-binding protein [Vicinamibacterales bacterium]